GPAGPGRDRRVERSDTGGATSSVWRSGTGCTLRPRRSTPHLTVRAVTDSTGPPILRSAVAVAASARPDPCCRVAHTRVRRGHQLATISPWWGAAIGSRHSVCTPAG